MKYLLFTLITLLSIQLFAQNPIEKEGWELTFNDEFNAKKLDYSKWQDHYYWGGRTNEGSLNFYGREQFEFSDSTLRIVAEKKKAPNDMDYVSGLIDCNKSFKQQYGYFEIRSKNPKGTGFWPAFWLVSTEQWPPEIDIYEFFTNAHDIIKTNQHWLNKRKKKHMEPKRVKMKVDASDDFHIYAIDWQKNKLIWYYDNKRVKTSRRGLRYFKYKMHIIINNEISYMNDMNLEDAIFPNYFEIDYVRAYKKKED